jgi:hypothetical protein
MGFEQEASILVVRGWELACVSAWLVGLWLVVRAGSTPYLHGLFWGASGLAMWDWITNDVWLWNITAADLCRLAGLPSVGDPQRVPVRVGAARPAAERAAGEVPGGERNLAPFWMGLMVCPTGLYVAAWFSALFLERLDPFLH